MTTIPDALVRNVPENEQEHAKQWWATLSKKMQKEFLLFCDEKSDDTSYFGTVEEGALVWHELPIELKGRLIDPLEVREHKALKEELIEYVNNHEDVQFFVVEKKFHICRSHPAAAMAIKSGRIKADFRCPLNDNSCLMRRMLDACGGKDILVEVGVKS